MYQNLPLPTRPMKSHKQCLLVDCEPFGLSLSCTHALLQELQNITDSCKTFVPTLSLWLFFKLATIGQLDALVDSNFPTLAVSASNNRFYSDSTLQLNRLQDAVRILEPITRVETVFTRRLKYHCHTLPSDNAALCVLGNLKILRGCINRKRMRVESTLWEGLDEYPEATEAELRVLLDSVW
jgi:hypothetical protein